MQLQILAASLWSLEDQHSDFTHHLLCNTSAAVMAEREVFRESPAVAALDVDCQRPKAEKMPPALHSPRKLGPRSPGRSTATSPSRPRTSTADGKQSSTGKELMKAKRPPALPSHRKLGARSPGRNKASPRSARTRAAPRPRTPTAGEQSSTGEELLMPRHGSPKSARKPSAPEMLSDSLFLHLASFQAEELYGKLRTLGIRSPRELPTMGEEEIGFLGLGASGVQGKYAERRLRDAITAAGTDRVVAYDGAPEAAASSPGSIGTGSMLLQDPNVMAGAHGDDISIHIDELLLQADDGDIADRSHSQLRQPAGSDNAPHSELETRGSALFEVTVKATAPKLASFPSKDGSAAAADADAAASSSAASAAARAAAAAAAAAAARTNALRAELRPLKQRALLKRAFERGVKDEDLDAADATEQPTVAIIELIVAASFPSKDEDAATGATVVTAAAAAATAKADALWAELRTHKIRALLKRASECGLTDEDLEVTDHVEDPNEAIIELIVSAMALQPEKSSPVSDVPPCKLPSPSPVRPQKGGGAIAAAAGDEEIWNIDGTEIDLNAKYKMGGQAWYLQDRAKEAIANGGQIAGEPANQRAKDAGRLFSGNDGDSTDSQTIKNVSVTKAKEMIQDKIRGKLHSPAQVEEARAALRGELEALKMSVLKKRAVAAGATAEQIETAEDADSPQDALIEMLLEIERSRMAKDSGPAEHRELALPERRVAFHIFDRDGGGTVSMEEFKYALKRYCGLQVSPVVACSWLLSTRPTIPTTTTVSYFKITATLSAALRSSRPRCWRSCSQSWTLTKRRRWTLRSSPSWCSARRPRTTTTTTTLLLPRPESFLARSQKKSRSSARTESTGRRRKRRLNTRRAGHW